MTEAENPVAEQLADIGWLHLRKLTLDSPHQ
jgi:hypothetical protein